MEVGDSVRVEKLRWDDRRYEDLDGASGRLVELREEETLVEPWSIMKPDLKGPRRWVDRRYLRRFPEPSVNLDSFLAD